MPCKDIKDSINNLTSYSRIQKIKGREENIKEDQQIFY